MKRYSLLFAPETTVVFQYLLSWRYFRTSCYQDDYVWIFIKNRPGKSLFSAMRPVKILCLWRRNPLPADFGTVRNLYFSKQQQKKRKTGPSRLHWKHLLGCCLCLSTFTTVQFYDIKISKKSIMFWKFH